MLLKKRSNIIKEIVETRIPYSDCWAKTINERGDTGLGVLSHGLAVAEVCKCFLAEKSTSFKRKFLEYLQYLPLFCAIHDVGKVSPDFQVKSEMWKCCHKEVNLDNLYCPYQGNHSAYSFEAVYRFSKGKLRNWADVVGVHHGTFKNFKIEPRASAWEDEREAFIKEMISQYGEFPNCDIPIEIAFMMAGILTYCDWIASANFAADKDFSREDACNTARKIFGNPRTGFCSGANFKNIDINKIFDFPLNDLQKASLDICKGQGIYLIEAPTGVGKTEAALLMAYKLIAAGEASGLYFALPTRLTSNMIFARMETFLKRVEVSGVAARLIHGTSWLEDIAVPRSVLQMRDLNLISWYNSPRRALMFPFGVGTVDQALMSVLPVKHMFLRNAALSDKVVIIDEVHSYDAYTGNLIAAFAKRLRALGSTVIILSATLSKSTRSHLMRVSENVKYPFVAAEYSTTERDFIQLSQDNQRRVEIQRENSDTGILEAVKTASSGQCVLYVCNTVASSQNVYEKIKMMRQEGDYQFEFGLLHSRFPKFRRDEIETKWMTLLGKDRSRRPERGCLLVATQIVEQSVDIDADVVFSELCPIDMLIQRCGRCFRHQLRRSPLAVQPKLFLIEPDLKNALDSFDALKKALGASAKVYHPYSLLKTFKLLQETKVLELPRCLESYMNQIYETPASDELERVVLADLNHKKSKLEEQAVLAMGHLDLMMPDEESEECGTRICDVPTEECLFCRENDDGSLRLLSGDRLVLEGEFSNEAHRQRIRLIAANAIRIPAYFLKSSGLFSDDKIQHIYQNKKIYKIKVDNDLTVSFNKIVFQYASDIGVSFSKVRQIKEVLITDRFTHENFQRHLDLDDDEI